MTIAIVGKLGHRFVAWAIPRSDRPLISNAQSETPETSLTISKDNTAVVKGPVLDNIKKCTVDLSCYLEMKFQNETVHVVYVTAEGQPCVNEQGSRQGINIKKGQRVEAYGQYHKEGQLHIISTCPSGTFYIKILPPVRTD